jgi:uncharacterized protein YecE (DUF72 family)
VHGARLDSRQRAPLEDPPRARRSSPARRTRRPDRRAASPAGGAATLALHPAHIGCSGWNYASWRGGIYPPGLPSRRWLERYGELFDTVEVNATFYRLLKRETAARWLTQTPPEFLFAVKASRYLTHIRRLADVSTGIARFYDGIAPLRDAGRLGPVLWQLPANFTRDERRLAALLAELPPGRHAFEFRDPSWFVDEVYELLRAHGACLVFADHPERPFQTFERTCDWTYVRLHYGHRGRRGNYSERELARWAERVHAWRREGELFAYFNNDWEGFATRNACRLSTRLGELLRAEQGSG